MFNLETEYGIPVTPFPKTSSGEIILGMTHIKNSSTTRSFLKLFSLMFLSVSLGACGIQSIPRQSNEVEAAWAEVINQYQRRADLVPNLVEVVKGYAKQEQETLTKVVEARASATQIKLSSKDLSDENLAKFQAAQDQLKGAL